MCSWDSRLKSQVRPRIKSEDKVRGRARWSWSQSEFRGQNAAAGPVCRMREGRPGAGGRVGVRCGWERCGLEEGQRSEDSLLWGRCSPSHPQAPLRVENMSHPKPGEAGRARLGRRPKADSLLWNITHLLLGTEAFSRPPATSHPAPGPHGRWPSLCRLLQG